MGLVAGKPDFVAHDHATASKVNVAVTLHDRLVPEGSQESSDCLKK